MSISTDSDVYYEPYDVELNADPYPVFRRIRENEPHAEIREFTARCLDPVVGTGRFDLAVDLGAQMPLQLICMLLGNPNGVIATGEVFDAELSPTSTVRGCESMPAALP